MQKMIPYCLFIIIILLSCAPSLNREERLEIAFKLDKDFFKTLTRVKDDSLDTAATFFYEHGFHAKKLQLPYGMQYEDHFLVGTINKKTGQRTYQVQHTIQYATEGWRLYTQANYETPNGPQSQSLIKINSGVISCHSYACKHVEEVAFAIEESLLRTIATRSKTDVWNYKLLSKAGVESRDFLLPAEVGGLLERMDEYVKEKGYVR